MIYPDPRPNSKIGKVRIVLMQLHREHDSAGMLPTSCRFLFYELVTLAMRGWLDSLLPQPLEQILESERQQREQLRRLINRAHRQQP